MARIELRPAVDELRPPSPPAHQRGDLRLRWVRPLRHLVLRGATYLASPTDFRHAGGLHLLGLAGRDRGRRADPAAGFHHLQGIRRTGMAAGHPPGDRLDHLRDRVLRHHRQAQGQAHLCGQLVLRLVHPDHRDAAHRQPHVAAGELVQVLLDVLRRHRCHGPVVVRAQRRRLLPDHRLPRHDVLLRAQASRAPGLFLSAVHRPLLGADHPVHLGRPAPPALHRAAGLGAVAGHGDVADPPGTELGRHDQRHDDPLRRLA